FFILHQTDIPFSFNIIVENGSFEILLILKIKSILFKSNTVSKKINAAINMIASPISSELNFQLHVLKRDELDDALRKLTFSNESFISEGGKQTTFKIMKTGKRGVYYNGNMYLSVLKFDLKRYLKPYYYQRYKRKILINNIIDSLLKEKINARYIFNMKIYSFHMKRLRMRKLDKDRAKILDERFSIFEEKETRNFEYDLEDLQTFGSVIVKSRNLSEIERINEKMAGIIHGSWEVPLKRFCHKYEVKNIINPGYLNLRMMFASDYQLYKFFHLPTMLSKNQEKTFNIFLDAPPESVCSNGTITIGKVMENNRPINDFLLNLEELKRHVFICGGTGTGKSSFVQNLLNEMQSKLVHIPFLLIELKGEYSWLRQISKDVLFLEPGINFGINLFDPLMDPKIHAEQVYDIMKSSFDFSEGSEFSPQMEKVLVDVITITTRDPDPTKRNFDEFFKNAKNYINANKNKIPYLDKSWIAIENRIRRLAVGPLKNVFDTSYFNLPFDQLMKKKVIINLSNIIKIGGSKSDLFFFSNMLLKKIWDHNLIKGPSRNINHVTIIEDSQYFSQNPNQMASRKSSYFEDIALLLRGTGEVLITISTRPDVSNNVLSNCGLIVAFQSKLTDDIEKLQGILHLSEDQRSLLEILPVFTALIKTNSHPYPFLLKTKKLFDVQEEVNPTSNGPNSKSFRKNRWKNLKKLSDFISNKIKKKSILDGNINGGHEDFELKRIFLSKVKKYYELKDRVWRNFRDASIEEIKEFNNLIMKLKYELISMVENNQDIKKFLGNSRWFHPRIENLEKFCNEIAAVDVS
ncbi:MAG: ATP-binding protein, partial [Candidatus Hodarchaeota archaeon]